MTASSDEVPRAFRRHFASHNRRVILLLGLTLLLAALGWAVCYGVVLWLVLLIRTIWSPMDEQPLPPQLPVIFVTASLLLMIGLLIARRHRIERVTDRKRWWQHAGGVILALPAATVSLWGTFTAYQFLDQEELRLAWQLLRRIQRERRLPLHAVPQEIAAESVRHRVLVALQITDLIRVLTVGGEMHFVLANDEARQLAGPRVRLQLPPR